MKAVCRKRTLKHGQACVTSLSNMRVVLLRNTPDQQAERTEHMRNES